MIKGGNRIWVIATEPLSIKKIKVGEKVSNGCCSALIHH